MFSINASKLFTNRNIWFFIAFVVFVYLLLRAFYVPYTHDEIATYFHFIQKQEFIPGQAQWDANNHVLNSYLSVIMYRTFGPEVFFLRLPNVLSFLLYFFAAWKLSVRINSPLLKNVLLVALVFSHGYSEFFALNRGYGLSMAFLLSLIVIFNKLNEDKKTVYFLLYALLGSLAVWANLTLLPVVLILDFLLVLSILVKRIKAGYIHWIIIVFGVFLIKLPAAWFGFELSNRGALYYGGDEFYNLTVQCLEKMMWGFYNVFTDSIVVLIFSVTTIIFVVNILKRKITYPALIISLLFFFSLSAIFAQHIILGTNYPEDRTGMYLWPLMVLTFIFLLDIVPIKYLKYSALLFVLLPVHFIYALNLSGVTIWQNQGMPGRFYEFIRNDYKGDRPFLGASQKLLGFAWTFHDHMTDPIMGPVQHTGYTDGLADYIIAIPKHFNEIDFKKYEKVDEDKWSGTILLKRKEHVPLVLVSDSVFENNIKVNGKEFFGLMTMKTDSVKGKNVAVEVEGSISSFDNILYALVVWSGSTKEKPNYYYEQYHFDWYRRCIHNFRVCYILKEIPKDMDEIKVYIFNTRFQNYIINRCQVRVYFIPDVN